MPAAAKAHPVLRDAATVEAVRTYYLNHAKAAKLDAENKLLKEQIIAAMGNREVASCGKHVVRVTETAGTQSKPNWTITKEHIGVVVVGSKGRAGSVKLEVI